ncbi:MAG TPA: hypothetical protein VHX17_12410 [Candidatus Cybelea sp.]|nr:hypothetical protein [Candidatus Cybelea sp.]
MSAADDDGVVRALRGLSRWSGQRYEGREAKQSRQYTGLSPRGLNGTSATPPHWLHVAVNISRGRPAPRSPPPPLPPPALGICLRA